jgi:ribosomal RNA assembly protein
MQHVKVPDDRIGVLIGGGGETMREIEDRAEVRLDIDSETGNVRVEKVGDPVKGLKGPDIVKALEDDMMMFDLIDIDAASRNKRDLRRHKGRLIGEDGRTRELMQELTGASVTIYGSTLGIIGGPEQVDAVREAAEMILEGAPHGAVYSFLERKRNELKHKGMEYHSFTG